MAIMSTDTLERPDTVIVTEEQLDDESGFRHYFSKDDLDKNLFEGTPITAICGFVKVGLANPPANLPTCPKCKFLYDNVVQPGDGE